MKGQLRSQLGDRPIAHKYRCKSADVAESTWTRRTATINITGRVRLPPSQKRSNMSDVPPPQRRFRKRSKTWYLTFPQCEASMQDTLDILRLEDLEWAAISEEAHEDGNGHLHAVFRLRSELSISDPHYWDFLTGSHCNIQTPRNVVDVMKYVIKDGRYVQHNIDCKSYIKSREKKKSTSTAKVVGLIKEGKTDREIDTLFPEFVFRNIKPIREYRGLLSQWEYEDSIQLSPWIPLTEDYGTPQDNAIRDWLNANLFKERTLGQKQLYLYGPSGKGKSSLVERLMKFCRIYPLGYSEDFFDDYDDSKYDLIVADEFKAQRSIQFMNMFMDTPSVGFPLKRKGTSPYIKRKRLPMIILSNFTVSDVYRKNKATNFEQWVAFDRRVEQIEVSTMCQVLYTSSISMPVAVPQSPVVVSPNPQFEYVQEEVVDSMEDVDY